MRAYDVHLGEHGTETKAVAVVELARGNVIGVAFGHECQHVIICGGLIQLVSLLAQKQLLNIGTCFVTQRGLTSSADVS